MAFHRGPNIVKNGLVFWVDAANTKSYPTTGTTWYDLSLKKINGSLTNGPAFESINNGVLSFDGINDYINFGSFNYSPGTTGEISLELFLYPTGPYSSYLAEPPTTNLAGVFGQSYYNYSTGWGVGIYVQNNINYFAFQVRNLGTISQTNNVPFNNNNWYHLVGTFTRNDYNRLYVNGILSASGSTIPLNGLTITPNLTDASLGGIRNFYAGSKISIARIYNRPLTQSEILQNYNTIKSRFNL